LARGTQREGGPADKRKNGGFFANRSGGQKKVRGLLWPGANQGGWKRRNRKMKKSTTRKGEKKFWEGFGRRTPIK